MNVYKLQIKDRNYAEWDILETVNFEHVKLDINPVSNKMFSNDVFQVTENNDVVIIHSSVRRQSNIPGVLILQGNKTYGRNKNGRMLYKCEPDDIRMPSFLIPYDIKNLGFSKVFHNLYVTFSFIEWTDKHPIGSLMNVIGEVNALYNFYEYQLYCKSLNASIQQFQKQATKAIKQHTDDTFIDSMKLKYPLIEDRTNKKDWHIFTIDPINSVDLDDAFSVKKVANETTMVSIYIANVSIWMDVLNLWDTFSRRISTIYLPDKKRPMLPTILSDCLCSLQANNNRVAFCMDIFIKDDQVVDVKYLNCFINVSKNYHYEADLLLKDPAYQQLFEITTQLAKTYKYINNIKSSHEVVTYLMMFMNCHCAKVLIDKNVGIFRTTVIKGTYSVPDDLNENVAKFIKIWNSSSGQYVDGAAIVNKDAVRHDLLNMESYIHITSPIRRLVDLLNIIKFQQITNMTVLTDNASVFYDNWLKELDYINITMRSIRKIQCDCNLLDLCCNNPSIIDKEYDAYVFDKIVRNDGLFQYIVYLPELKLASRITTRENYQNFQLNKIKLYLFHDEARFKRKIRLQIIQ
jgi:exoribonuclease R